MDLKIIGQASTVEKSAVRFQIKACQNSTEGNDTEQNICETPENIRKFTSEVMIAVSMLKTYFDQDDYENPLKNDMTLDYMGLNERNAFNQIVTVQKRYLKTKDSWFSGFFDNQEYVFYDS